MTENHRRVARETERGVTFLEAIVVLTILVFIVTVMLNLTTTAGNSQKYSERMARSTELGQQTMNEIRGELVASVGLFQADAIGTGYWSALTTDPLAPPLGSSGLPTANVNGVFSKEATPGALTGNALFFARQAWTTEFECTSGNVYLLDVFRLTAYYLTKEEGGPQPGVPVGLNLSKFVSEPLADGDQIDKITDATDQTEVLVHLVTGSADVHGDSHMPAKLVWRRGRDIGETDAVREIDSITGIMSSTPLAPRPAGSWKVLLDPERSARGLMYYRHFSVATNYGHQRLGVARFGAKTNTADGFPHGFEVQFTGPSSARQVLLHLSIVSHNHGGTRAHANLRATVFVQDV